jgi:hypothetical protein
VERSRARHRFTVTACAVALATAPVVGCGESYSRDEALAAVTEANPDLTGEQAECVTDGLVERYGLGDLSGELSTDSPSQGFTEDQFREMFLCGVEGDVGQELADELEAAGVDADRAPCVSDQVVDTLSDEDIDALLAGDITAELAEKLAAALVSCGAADS